MMPATTEQLSRARPAPLVKICGITREVDARAAVQSGANALGFNFYSQSARYLAPNRAAEIIAWAPGPYLKVGVFVNPSIEELLATLRDVPLDVVQLHGPRCPLAALSSLPGSVRIWRATTVESFSSETSSSDAFVLDSPTPAYGGSGKPFDWSAALPFARALQRPFLLAGGLDSVNVAAAIATLRPWGVDACSKLESSPGCKDAALVRAFVSAAVTAFEYLPRESLL